MNKARLSITPRCPPPPAQTHLFLMTQQEVLRTKWQAVSCSSLSQGIISAGRSPGYFPSVLRHDRMLLPTSPPFITHVHQFGRAANCMSRMHFFPPSLSHRLLQKWVPQMLTACMWPTQCIRLFHVEALLPEKEKWHLIRKFNIKKALLIGNVAFKLQKSV